MRPDAAGRGTYGSAPSEEGALRVLLSAGVPEPQAARAVSRAKATGNYREKDLEVVRIDRPASFFMLWVRLQEETA